MHLSAFYHMAIAQELWKFAKPIPHAHRSTGADRADPALGEATSSKTQVMTYPYYVGILEPSPPTIYHGQGLA